MQGIDLKPDYTALVIKVLDYVKPIPLTPDSSLFSVGYEEAKKDIAKAVLKELGYTGMSQLEMATKVVNSVDIDLAAPRRDKLTSPDSWRPSKVKDRPPY